MSKKLQKRRGGYSLKNEICKRKRELQRNNYNKLRAKSEHFQGLDACGDVLLKNMSVRASAKKHYMSHTTLQRYLNKLEKYEENPLMDKRKGNGKISLEIKSELRELMTLQPFKMPPVKTPKVG